MHHCADVLFGNDSGEQTGVLDIALVKWHRFGHRPAKAGDQIVDDCHRPTGIGQGEHGVAADIAGTAGNEDRAFLGHDAAIG